MEDLVEFAALAEELGFDGITVTEHHAPLMVCPSPHLLLAAAARQPSRIRRGTAVTVLPLYSPIRVAEEAGMLDLLSGGRFELGLGRGIPGEAQVAVGRNAEFHVEGITDRKSRPVIAVAGPPGQVVEGLQQVIDETGAAAARRDLLPR